MPKIAIFGYFCLISQKIRRKFKILFPAFFLSTQRSHKKISALKLKRCDLSFFLKPEMSKFDLFFDPWPLTFWPMTSPFGDLLAITKTHIGYEFHNDPPMGTWWKVGDTLTDWLTHSLTHKATSKGWAMPPKNINHNLNVLAIMIKTCTFLGPGAQIRNTKLKFLSLYVI